MDDDKKKYFRQLEDLYGDEIFLSLDNHAEKIPTDLTKKDDPNRSRIYKDKIKNCLKCDLGNLRKSFVFGSGDPNASLLIIGETPGEQEDLSGEPFVGKAGKLLDKMLLAINRSRDDDVFICNDDVFICNVLKCRPPENRDPKKEEIEECEPYLINQIDLIQPKLIVALGRIAGKTLLGVEKSLKEMRGVLHKYHSRSLIVTYHPAALLRNPNWKHGAWEDFKLIQKLLD